MEEVFMEKSVRLIFIFCAAAIFGQGSGYWHTSFSTPTINPRASPE